MRDITEAVAGEPLTHQFEPDSGGRLSLIGHSEVRTVEGDLIGEDIDHLCEAGAKSLLIGERNRLLREVLAGRIADAGVFVLPVLKSVQTEFVSEVLPGERVQVWTQLTGQVMDREIQGAQVIVDSQGEHAVREHSQYVLTDGTMRPVRLTPELLDVIAPLDLDSSVGSEATS